MTSGDRTRAVRRAMPAHPGRRAAIRALAVSVALASLGGCAAPADPAACNRFASGQRTEENVPDCLLRDRDTLLNGLAPIYPGERM